MNSPPSSAGPQWLARRDNAIVAGIAIAASVVILTYAATEASKLARLNDFYREAWPSYRALGHAHLLTFFRTAPSYVGSLVLRAPFALIGGALGGSARAAYFAAALPCVLAVAAFATWLAAQPRSGNRITWASRLGPVACLLANPIVIIALLGGHPEELLGAVLCVAAVVLAVKGRAELAALAMGLAVVNKAWAVVAVPVLLVALPHARMRAALIIGGIAATLLPLIALESGGISAGTVSLRSGVIFNPPQLMWWFGAHSWTVEHARLVLVSLAFSCAALWWTRIRHSRAAMTDALLLLALVMLLRAALDPWNNLYYHIPFLLALIAFEIRAGRMPVVTVVFSLVLLVVVPVNGVPHMSHDLRAAAYAAVALPTIGFLTWRLLFRANRSQFTSPARGLGFSVAPLRADEAQAG
jgi:hypothetical protein